MQSIVISGKYMIDHNEESGLIYNIGDACVYKISVNTAKRLEEQAIQSRDNAESLITEINHLTINNSPSYITTSTYKNIFSSQSTGRLNKLTIIVNNLCNLNCKYCYANGGDYDRPVSIMNSADAKQYLDALLEQGITEIKIINFFGGEPLLNPETINFICEYTKELFKNKKLNCLPRYTLITNGTICNDYIISILQRHNIIITVSIDGDKFINDFCRTGPNIASVFEKVDHNIKCLKKNGLTPHLIEATYTCYHEKYGYSREQVEHYLKEKFSVNQVFIGDCSGELMPTSTSLADKNIFKEDYTRLSYLINSKKQAKNIYLCDAGVRSILLDSNGDIYPCQYFLSDNSFCLAKFDSTVKKFVNYPYAADFEKYSNKDLRSDCSKCWAKILCKTCVFSLYKSPKSKTLYNCTKRKERYKKILFDFCKKTTN